MGHMGYIIFQCQFLSLKFGVKIPWGGKKMAYIIGSVHPSDDQSCVGNNKQTARKYHLESC